MTRRQKTENRGQPWTARHSGSVLIAALWVVVLLSLIVSSFAFDMHVEGRVTSFYRKRLKADYLAKAGMERARMLLVKSLDTGIQDEDNYEDRDVPWYPNAKRLSEPLVIRSIPPMVKSCCAGPSCPTNGTARAMFDPTVFAHIES